MSQENLLNAVISSNIDEIVNLLKSGVEVTKDIVSEADKTLKEFEKQSKKNKALLNDTTIEHTNQYRIYKMLFLYMKGYELKSILTTYGYNVESKQIENKQKVKNKNAGNGRYKAVDLMRGNNGSQKHPLILVK